MECNDIRYDMTELWAYLTPLAAAANPSCADPLQPSSVNPITNYVCFPWGSWGLICFSLSIYFFLAFFPTYSIAPQ